MTNSGYTPARALAMGDTIAVVAPGSAPDEHRLQDGIERLKSLGLRIVNLAQGNEPYGYLSASDSVRCSALNDAIRDPNVRAIICARGGYGTMRLLQGIDYAELKKQRTLIIGYSDITALQLATLARCQLCTLAGPMVAPDWPELTDGQAQQFRYFTGMEPYIPASHDLTTRVTGEVEGPLIPVTLSMLISLLGTPYLPDLDGSILVLEEIDEAPYRIDRMLCQLSLAGILDRLGGVVLASFSGCDPLPGKPSLSMDDVFDDYVANAGVPVVSGLNFGHLNGSVYLPFGAPARLEAADERATLHILSSPVG